MIDDKEWHVMIDLETLGTGDRSVVTQLGWASFCPHEEGVLMSGKWALDPQEQLDLGRKADWSTIAWWLRQDEEARLTMANAQGYKLKDALHLFKDKFEWRFVDGIWGHGATFDISLLGSLHDLVGLRHPWPFKAVRDTRTLFWAAPEIEWPRNPVKHDAEQDARAQAVAIQRALKELGSL